MVVMEPENKVDAEALNKRILAEYISIPNVAGNSKARICGPARPDRTPKIIPGRIPPTISSRWGEEKK